VDGEGERMECSLKQQRLVFCRADKAIERSAMWYPCQECGRFQGAWRESPSCEPLEVWSVIEPKEVF